MNWLSVLEFSFHCPTECCWRLPPFMLANVVPFTLTKKANDVSAEKEIPAVHQDCRWHHCSRSGQWFKPDLSGHRRAVKCAGCPFGTVEGIAAG